MRGLSNNGAIKIDKRDGLTARRTDRGYESATLPLWINVVWLSIVALGVHTGLPFIDRVRLARATVSWK